MPVLTTAALPAHPRRIVLVNPTRYLGNLLIAGGLIQRFAAFCRERDIEFTLVVDADFRQLLEPVLPANRVLCYPRRAIKQATVLAKLQLYWKFVLQLRAFGADIAFNIEEDSVSHRLTQLSGAGFKLGCSPQRHGLGYQRVIPIDFTQRPPGQQHRWHSFQAMFAVLGLPPSAEPGYLQLKRDPPSAALRERLQQAGLQWELPQVVIHAGATKDYKKWPPRYFAELCDQLRACGKQVVFIGAGKDAAEIAGVLQLVSKPHNAIVNLSNQLSLAELASYFTQVQLIVGNDSGPFHLAAAQGVPGVVIFGPTNVNLWGPLSAKAQALQGREACDPACSRQRCVSQHRCLTSLTPAIVMTQLAQLDSQLLHRAGTLATFS
jgi:ADP-heptose:LPS heptosyltransferase